MVASHEAQIEGDGRFRILCSPAVSSKSNDCLIANTSLILVEPNSIVIPIALRLEFIHHAHTSSNSIYTNVAVTILTTITTHLATMSSTLPCLKQFLAMFDSGMIGEYTDATYTGSGKGTRTDQSIALASLASSTGARVGKRRRGSDELRLRPDQSAGDAGAEITVENSSTISEQSNSGIIKETRRWEVSYERW